MKNFIKDVIDIVKCIVLIIVCAPLLAITALVDFAVDG